MTNDNDKPRAPRNNDRPRDGARGGTGPRKPFEERGERPRQSYEERKAAAAQGEAPRIPEGERIAKRLARAGISSRRDAELLIADGRVSVNGKVLTSPAFNVQQNDKVSVDGQLLPGVERTRLWLYNKPAGLVTTAKDPEGRQTVFEALPEGLPRVISVGRLDINTEGLLLLTNDGGVARILELPATGWLRKYRARAFGKVTQEQLTALKDGITIDGVFYGAIEAVLDTVQGSNVWITLGLREGKNREVKNILGALGLSVNRLIRISFGPFQLGDLEEGSVQEVNGRTLRDQLGERLIEESGANFEAPIYNDFSNQPVQGDYARSDNRVSNEPERPQHRRQGDWVGGYENPIVKHQPRKTKEKPTDTENAVAKRPNRSANVWRAQGAKPLGPEKLSEPVGRYGGRGGSRTGEPDRVTTRSANFRNASATGQRDSEKREWKLREGGDERPKREYTPRSDKPMGERTSSFSGEKREYKPRDGGAGEDRPKRAYAPRGDKPFGDRPPRPAGDRPFGDRPKRYEGASASGEKREYKPREGGDDRPKRDYAPRGDRPAGDRPARPAGDRPFSDRPKRYEGSNPAARDDSTAGERKPWDGASSKDRQNKTFGKRDDNAGERPKRDGPKREGPKRFEGGKPFGAKPYAGKPSGGRPAGGRPTGGGKPFGGKPRSKA